MKASIRRQIEINKVKYRIKQIEKEDRRLHRMSRESSRDDHIVIKIGSEINCHWCAETFIKVQSRQVYCSLHCRLSYKASLSVSAGWKKWKRKRQLDPTNVSKFKGTVLHSMERLFGECLVCEITFDKNSPVQKYCTKCGEKMKSYAFRKKVADKLLTDIAKDQVDG